MGQVPQVVQVPGQVATGQVAVRPSVRPGVRRSFQGVQRLPRHPPVRLHDVLRAPLQQGAVLVGGKGRRRRVLANVPGGAVQVAIARQPLPRQVVRDVPQSAHSRQGCCFLRICVCAQALSGRVHDSDRSPDRACPPGVCSSIEGHWDGRHILPLDGGDGADGGLAQQAAQHRLWRGRLLHRLAGNGLATAVQVREGVRHYHGVLFQLLHPHSVQQAGTISLCLLHCPVHAELGASRPR